jgi:hypothetical protein
MKPDTIAQCFGDEYSLSTHWVPAAITPDATATPTAATSCAQPHKEVSTIHED